MQWQSFLDAVHRKYIPRNIEGCKNECELISLILYNRKIEELLSAWLNEQNASKTTKCGEKSKRLKEEGNVAFKKQNYLQSVDLYTQSAKLAPFHSADFAISIANRAAAFFYLKEYKKCLQDIAVAFDSNYPKNLHYKLHIRGAECHLKLRNAGPAKIECSKGLDLIKFHDNLSDQIREKLIQRVLTIESLVLELPEDSEISETVTDTQITLENLLERNPDFPCASHKITRDSSPTRGRFTVAKTDIKRGDVLFVEKPFAFVPLDHATSKMVCAHCCGSIDNACIPCRACTEVNYCNQRCWRNSWLSYHQWECPGYEMGIWRQIGIAHLALKLLLVSATTSDNIRLNEVIGLVTHFDKQPSDDLAICAITASMITSFLERHTTFLRSVDLRVCLADKLDKGLDIPSDISGTEGKKIFVGSLLLRHMLQLIANGHAITRLNLIDGQSEHVIEEQQQRVAVGIYPSASMMNHSCDPSIMNTFWNDFLVVKAAKDIPAGAEIFNCYGPHFRRMDVEERQETLQNQYFFTCRCFACTNPVLKYFSVRFRAWKCRKCSGPLIGLSNGPFKCLDCGAELETPSDLQKHELNDAEVFFNSAQEHLQHQKFQKSMDDLKTSLNIRKKWLFRCHDDIATTFDALAQVSVNLGLLTDAILYLQESLLIVDEKFGDSSIEAANELNKITDICIEYLQYENLLPAQKFKKMVKKTREFLLRAKKIIDTISGPWNRINQEVFNKINILNDMEKNIA